MKFAINRSEKRNSMEVTNCRTCGRLFNYISGRQMCPLCRDQLEKKFQEVKMYVEENPGATLSTVSQEMEVSVKQLKDWIREERLILTEAWGEICCDVCGKAIKTGKFCEECKRKMVTNLGSAYGNKNANNATKTNNLRKDSDAKMRFFDK